MLKPIALAALFATLAMPAFAGTGLLEPSLKMPVSKAQAKGAPVRVAITLDACMGKTDFRILNTLVQEKIPATIFVTARWLKHNSDALAILMAHPDLFELENHGENHIPAVDKPVSIYGIAAAGSEQAVVQEVEGGRQAILAATGQAAAMVSRRHGKIHQHLHDHDQPTRRARGRLFHQWRWRFTSGKRDDG